VTPILRVLLLAALFAPGLALAQSFAVNAPFDPGRYAPLDGHERFVRWWNEDGGSSSIHLTALLDASVTQVVNTPPEWGRTAGGFLRRGASSYGSNIIQNTTHEGLAYAMGTDTRYFACNCRGFLPRSGHALQMTLLTYNMSGHKTLDIPQIAGAYGGPMVATMWWPRHYTPLVQGVQVGHLEIGLIGTIHMVQEFSPDLKRFFLWRKRDY
jgi:hypothetical protein